MNKDPLTEGVDCVLHEWKKEESTQKLSRLHYESVFKLYSLTY